LERQDKDQVASIDDAIATRFEALPESQQTYALFVTICNDVEKEKLPNCVNTVNTPTQHVQHHQNVQRLTYDRLEDERKFEKNNFGNPTVTWKLIKELSGKKKSVTFIQGDDRLNIREKPFSKLLSVERNDNIDFNCVKLFDIYPEISTAEFSEDKTVKVIMAMKQDKAPGLDGLTLDVWKLKNMQKYLKLFCIQTFNSFRPDEWGLSEIVPVSK